MSHQMQHKIEEHLLHIHVTLAVALLKNPKSMLNDGETKMLGLWHQIQPTQSSIVNHPDIWISFQDKEHVCEAPQPPHFDVPMPADIDELLFNL